MTITTVEMDHLDRIAAEAGTVGAAVGDVSVTASGASAPKLGMVSQAPALSLFGSSSRKASGFAAKMALTAGHSPTGRFSMRCTISDSESPGCTW